MIKNIIFDFGDVFINLDKEAIFKELGQQDSYLTLSPELLTINNRFEVGAMQLDEFLSEWATIFPKLGAPEITRIWNSVLLDFPDHRLDFLEQLAAEEKYRLFLLSNTNTLHMAEVLKIMGSEKFNRFKACFNGFYLSHEVKLRKPDRDIYEFVLKVNELSAEETFFIDDTKENTDAAAALGIMVWHLKVGQEDVKELRTKL